MCCGGERGKGAGGKEVGGRGTQLGLRAGRPAGGAPAFLGGSCRVKVSLFSAKRGWSCGHPSKARLCCGGDRQGRLGKASWKGPHPLAGHVSGGSQREPQELGYIFMPFPKPWAPAIYF